MRGDSLMELLKYSGEHGLGSEAEFEGDLGKTEIRVLQIENGLMGTVVFQVGTQAYIEVLSKVCPEVTFGHMRGLSHVRNALRRTGVLGEELLYRVYQFGPCISCG